MNNSKLYVGRLVQVIPCKGYGFISPKWNDGDNSLNNIYCYYASSRERARRKCFIKMLDKSKTSLHEEIKNYKGEVLWVSTEPQKIFFRVAFQATENGHKLMAYDLFDEKNLSEEEKAEAEANSIGKPSFADAFTVAENGEEIDRKSLKEEVVEKAPVEETPKKAPVEVVEEKPTTEESAEEPIEERKEGISIEEPTEEDGYDSEEDEEYSEEDNSSYYGELAGQYGYDDEVVNCYKPIRARRYDDEVVRDKKSQKKASKAKRAQKTFKPEEDEE